MSILSKVRYVYIRLIADLISSILSQMLLWHIVCLLSGAEGK